MVTLPSIPLESDVYAGSVHLCAGAVEPPPRRGTDLGVYESLPREVINAGKKPWAVLRSAPREVVD